MLHARGFSLIELLVVIGIVGVLSVIAIPSYGEYIVKARVVELLSIADSYKLKLIDNLFSDNADQKLVYNLNTNLVDYVAINSVGARPTKHIIQVVAKMKSNTAAGIGLAQPATANDALAIQLHGVEDGDMINWSCHVALDYNKYVPKNCQNNDMEAVSVG